jgi:hypothetical protein
VLQPQKVFTAQKTYHISYNLCCAVVGTLDSVKQIIKKKMLKHFSDGK